MPCSFFLAFFHLPPPPCLIGAAPNAANLGGEHRGLRVLHGRQRRASDSNLRLLGSHPVAERCEGVGVCVCLGVR